MKWDGKNVFTLFLLVVAACFVVLAFSYSPRGRLVPLLVGIPTFLLLAWQLISQNIASKQQQQHLDIFGVDVIKVERGLPEESDVVVPVEKELVVRRFVAFTVMLIAYLLGSYLLGMIPASVLFLLLFFLGVKERPLLAVAMTAGLWAVIHILFVVILRVPFSPGLLIEML